MRTVAASRKYWLSVCPTHSFRCSRHVRTNRHCLVHNVPIRMTSSVLRDGDALRLSREPNAALEPQRQRASPTATTSSIPPLHMVPDAAPPDLLISALEKTEQHAMLCHIVRNIDVDNMSVSEFCALAQSAVGFDRPAARAWLDVAADAGLVVILPQDVVHFRPIEVLSHVNRAVAVPDAVRLDISRELEDVQRQLAPLETEKARLDARVRTMNQRMWGCVAFAVGNTAWLLARLVFIDFDWDVMEPISYFLMQLGAMAATGYFAYYGQEYTPTEVQLRIASHRQLRVYRKHGFPLDRYVGLRLRRDALLVALERHANWLPFPLTVATEATEAGADDTRAPELVEAHGRGFLRLADADVVQVLQEQQARAPSTTGKGVTAAAVGAVDTGIPSIDEVEPGDPMQTTAAYRDAPEPAK
eukprot:TRINITY_DN2904_c0_g2_i1.p1 TRINITY_DN2904_c0_g2~~TRINITY_DN2904_c0_g2_i1.p1  ORF type:complete len:416 (+),score=53.02 TRINITY_DN2904_c0_g2_i1:179-1426(+)